MRVTTVGHFIMRYDAAKKWNAHCVSLIVADYTNKFTSV